MQKETWQEPTVVLLDISESTQAGGSSSIIESLGGTIGS